MAYTVTVDDREYRVEIAKKEKVLRVSVDEKLHDVQLLETARSEFMVMVDSRLYRVTMTGDNELMIDDECYTIQVLDEQIQKLIKANPDGFAQRDVIIKAPMPGLVIDVMVSEGDAVKNGQGLFVIEAMKMQNEMKAPRDGVVKQLFVEKAKTVNSGDKLIIIE